MTRKEIAVEFVIPTAFAVAVGLVLGLVLSAGLFFWLRNRVFADRVPRGCGRVY